MKTFVLTTFIPRQAVDLLNEESTQNQCEALVSSFTKKGIVAAFNAAGIECTPYKLSQYGVQVPELDGFGYPGGPENLDVVWVRRLGEYDENPWIRLPGRPKETLTPMHSPVREARRERYETFRGSLVDEIQGYPI